jgi:hypothetical protein
MAAAQCLADTALWVVFRRGLLGRWAPHEEQGEPRMPQILVATCHAAFLDSRSLVMS